MEILAHVRRGLDVCAAFYGHPGVFVDSVARGGARAPARRASGLGCSPAISAEDCLFADLGVDPARFGCQSYEATDFLVHGRRVDPTATLVLWQIGTVGNVTPRPRRPSPSGLLCSWSTSCSSSTRLTTRSSSTRPRRIPGFDPLVRGAAQRARAGARDGDVDALRPAAQPRPARPHDAGPARSSETVSRGGSRADAMHARERARRRPRSPCCSKSAERCFRRGRRLVDCRRRDEHLGEVEQRHLRADRAHPCPAISATASRPSCSASR